MRWVVKYKPVVLNDHPYHSNGFLVEVFLLHSDSLCDQQSFSLGKLELIRCQPTAFLRLKESRFGCKTSLEDETKSGDVGGMKPTLQLNTWPRLMQNNLRLLLTQIQ